MREDRLATAPGPEQALRMAIHPVQSMIWITNTEGMCDFVCPSWTAFSGRDPSQELDVGWLNQVHEEDLPELRQRLEAAMKSRKPFRLLYRYRRADGVYRWIVNQGIVRTRPTGEFLGYIGQCFDITARNDA